MKKYYGGSDFKTLYYNFITRDASGKLFLMEDYEAESMRIGAGTTVFIEKATSFLLNILKDWKDEKPHVLIGDISMLFSLVDAHQKQNIQNKIKRGKEKFEKTHRMVIQLHNILREQQKLDNSVHQVKRKT